MGAKDGQFTREVGRLLSKWWTGDADADLLVKSNSSGARATVRAKRGLDVRGHAGDLAATDETIMPLLRLVTVEMKRGYNRAKLGEMLDLPDRGKVNEFAAFVSQAMRSARAAGTPYWALIHRRDRREAVVYFPRTLYKALSVLGAFAQTPSPFVTYYGPWGRVKAPHSWIVAVRLGHFLQCVKPRHVLSLYKEKC